MKTLPIRKLVVVAVVLALAGLSGCGDSAKPGQPADNTKKDGGGAGGGGDTLAKIKKEGVIKWGSDASGGAPYVFYDPKDKKTVIGFEMDIMDALSKQLGVKHERVQNDWDSLIDDMRADRSDIVMNGIEINEARKKAVGLSDAYYIYEQQLTVRAADKGKYKSLADLKGHKVATLKGAEANNVLKEGGFTEEQIKPYPDSSTPYTELDLERVDAVLQESIIAAYYAGPTTENKDKLFNVPQTFSEGKYAVAVRKEDESLLKEINRALAAIKKSGELAKIYKKWNIWNDKQKSIEVVDQ
jgi:polar amino acid transport system substrate-binding protein